jgi:hypothetical protein
VRVEDEQQARQYVDGLRHQHGRDDGHWQLEHYRLG